MQSSTIADADDVENNEQSTGKMLGGITGKGFLPGQSGNPAGRPKKLPITDAIRAELEQQGEDGVPNNVAIARVLVQLARSGNMDAIKEISDRTEGKARQRFEAGEGGESEVPLSIVLDL